MINLRMYQNNAYILSADIEHIKYFIGTNYNLFFQFKNQLRMLFQNLEDSEYAEETMSRFRFEVDQKVITSKNANFYEVSEQFLLNEELKLGAKSMLVKMIEEKMNSGELANTLYSVDILLKSLADEANTDNDLFNIKFKDFNVKNMIKIIEAYCIKEECSINQKDFDYTKFIEFQLKLIKQNIELSTKEYNIVLVNVPFINKLLLEKDLYSKRGIYICFGMPDIDQIDEKDFFLSDVKNIDFADEHEIFYIYQEKYAYQYNLQEVKNMCKEQIKQYLNDKNNSFFNLF